MDADSLQIRLTEIIEPVIKDNFMELVDLEVLAGGTMIRLLVDKIGARINLDEIAEISRMVAASMDAAGLDSGNYTLEVSSPGINRPIKKKEDFTRFAGKRVKIVTKEKINGSRVFTGKLEGINGENVSLSADGTEILVDFGNIRKANIDEDFFGGSKGQ